MVLGSDASQFAYLLSDTPRIRIRFSDDKRIL